MSPLLKIMEPDSHTSLEKNKAEAEFGQPSQQSEPIVSQYEAKSTAGLFTDSIATNRSDKVSREYIASLFEMPFMDLLMQAQSVHRQHFEPNEVQVSTLLSIKTGNCPEDCGYCSQSGYHRDKTGLAAEKLLKVNKVIAAAKQAKASGSSRFCMGAAWKHPSAKDMPYIAILIKEVKALGLETCMTLGMLTEAQSQQLAEAGLDYYNHNLDTSRNYYDEVVSTRSYDDRLQTIDHVRRSGIKVCSGSIVGMGESREDRIDWVYQLASMPLPPESIPVNLLVPIKGTPLGDKVLSEGQLPVLEWIRTIAVTRICCPTSYVRLSAGRESLSDSEQALAFMAGANSFFYGDKLLTTGNASQSNDDRLMQMLGLKPTAPKPALPVTDASSGQTSYLHS